MPPDDATVMRQRTHDLPDDELTSSIMPIEMTPTPPRNLIDYYKAIESSSARMLEAARARDWDSVVHCEGVSTILIEQLRQHGRHRALTREERQQKTRIMQRILRNDAQIRILAEPWLAQFDQLLSGEPQFLH